MGNLRPTVSTTQRGWLRLHITKPRNPARSVPEPLGCRGSSKTWRETTAELGTFYSPEIPNMTGWKTKQLKMVVSYLKMVIFRPVMLVFKGGTLRKPPGLLKEIPPIGEVGTPHTYGNQIPLPKPDEASRFACFFSSPPKWF